MKAKLQSLHDNNRGVSPVIGVILMVAITVILAAVIGGFVLNLGGDLEQTPQAQLSIEEVDGDVEISHRGGDSIPEGDIEVTFEASNDDSGSVTGPDTGTDDSFDVGDSATFTTADQSGVTSGEEVTVQLIHTPSDSILVENTVTIP